MPVSEPPIHDLEARIARLTPGQRDCLQLVHDHATSKEIARDLCISRHTVDQRLRLAIQVLGVSSRREAAIIFKAAQQASAFGHGAYQPAAYQASHIADVAAPGPSRATAGRGDEASDAEPELEARDDGEEPDDREDAPERRETVLSDAAAWSPAGFSPAGSFATVQERPQSTLRFWGGENDLSMTQRMIVILIVMIVGMLAFGMLLAGMEALAQLRDR